MRLWIDQCGDINHHTEATIIRFYGKSVEGARSMGEEVARSELGIFLHDFGCLK